jgi:hypothetical protein
MSMVASFQDRNAAVEKQTAHESENHDLGPQ